MARTFHESDHRQHASGAGAIPAPLFFALSLAVLVLGCGASAPSSPAPGVANGGAKADLIPFGPNITETVFALGQGDRVMAVSTFCDYPPEVASLPKVGGPMDPDKEKITMLAPALIISQGRVDPLAELAKQNGTPLLTVDMDSLASIDDGIATIGHTLGCDREAEALRQRVRADLDAVRQAVKDLPRTRVFILTGRMSHDLNNLYTAGGTSFLSELVTVAGGENIYGDAKERYLEASKETIVMRAPEVVLEFHAGETISEEEQRRFIEDWGQLPTLPAVENRRVYLILESHAMRPGPRVGLIARRLAKAIHPEARLAQP